MGLPDTQRTMLAVHRKQFCFGDSSLPIEDNHHIACAKPQHIGTVMGVGNLQFGCFPRPSFGWKVKAMRGHDREIRDSSQTVHDEKELPPATKELISPTHSWRLLRQDLRG
jgi:hypothetical protein